MDVVGWKGDLPTAWKINMRDILSRDEPPASISPSAHTTFVTEGAVICSFLPASSGAGRRRSSAFPSITGNTDYDEFIFYHDGDFFSKDNIRSRLKATATSARDSSRPAWGIPRHSPTRSKKTYTDEYAVMLDGLNPIHVLPAGEAVEWKEYWMSWAQPAEAVR